MIKTLDIEKVQINSIEASTFFLDETKLTSMYISYEIDGYSNGFTIKGERFEDVLNLVRSILIDELNETVNVVTNNR